MSNKKAHHRREARDTVESLFSMGPGLTMDDRYRFLEECLAKAREEGWEAAMKQCCEILDSVQARLDELLDLRIK